MTNNEFVRLMREKIVNVCYSHGYGVWWAWEMGKNMSSGEQANDPVEAMEALAKRLGWIESEKVTSNLQ